MAQTRFLLAALATTLVSATPLFSAENVNDRLPLPKASQASAHISFLADNGETTGAEAGVEFRVLVAKPLGDKGQTSTAVPPGQCFICTPRTAAASAGELLPLTFT